LEEVADYASAPASDVGIQVSGSGTRVAEALVRGRLDLVFLPVEPTFDLCYAVVDHEPLMVLMPSDKSGP
jgi:hypothetical protein